MGLVERSFFGGILILVILAVRALLRNKLPRRTFPVLWGAVLVRLLLPFSLSSTFSVYSILQKTADIFKPSPSVPGIRQNAIPAQILPGWTGIGEFGLENGITATAGEKSAPVLYAVWCAGAILCALFFVTAYVRCMRRFRRAVPVDNDWIREWLNNHRRGRIISVRKARRIAAPLTYGVFRPVILLPERLVWEERRELEYVLQHEYVHICHYDAAMKLLMLATLCVYWFHPLVWLMAVLLNRDIELACDEGVLRRFGEQARAGYAMALIGMEEKKGVLMPLYNGFSKNAIEERIKSIMKYKKATYAAVVGATALVLCIVLLFATSPGNAEAAEAGATLPENETGTPGDVLMDPPKGYVENVNRTPMESEASHATDTAERNAENKATHTTNKIDKTINGVNTEKAEYTLNYTTEGVDVEEPAYLYTGDGYYLLIPAEGWTIYAPDAWRWESNEMVQFWVNDCGERTWEQVETLYTEDGYSRTEVDGILRKEDSDRIFYVNIRKSEDRIMCFNHTYPDEPEYIEGFEGLLSVIAANFGILSQEDMKSMPENAQVRPKDGGQSGDAKDRQGEGNQSEDGKLAEQTARAFWEAYLAGDRDTLKQYLTSDYAGEPEVFPDGQDGHVAQEAEVLAIKGTDIGEKAMGDSIDIWVEFRPSEAADSLEYLWISLVKDKGGWIVDTYGLEM